MADLYASSRKPISLYKDRRYSGDLNEREVRLQVSTTLYVGNLSFYTREEQIFDLFSRVGEVKRIIMGLDRFRKTPCGFCFVEYFTRTDAEKSVHFISGTKLDERTIRVDYDVGYSAGRQYGRGRSGGQVRDEYRNDYDPGRGGFGKAMSGMGGMELWSSQGPPSGPPPIHPGMNRGRPYGGRGRGRGRGYRGGGSDRYHDGGYGDGYYGPQGGMKRRRDYDEGGGRYPRDGYHSKRRRSDPGPRYHGNENGTPPDRRGPPGNHDGHEMGPPRDGEPSSAPNGDEPVRNARFDRGKKDDEEKEDVGA